MTTGERMEIYFYELTAETPVCINCKHYYRHYLEDGRPLLYGHCRFPRLKPRKAYDTCGHFEQKTPPSTGTPGGQGTQTTTKRPF